MRAGKYGLMLNESCESGNKAGRPPSGAPTAISNRRSSASHEVEDDGNYGQYQQNVDKECGDVEHEEASQPQQEQNESKN